MTSDDYITGTIRIGWTISECDLGIAGIDRELLRVLYARIEDALTSALPQILDVPIDGEEKPPVRVVFKVMGDDEINDGPGNGTLDVPELALSNPGIDLELLREYEELNPFQDDTQPDSYSIEHPFSDRARSPRIPV